jgi:FxLD family lantipeptide
MSVLIGERSDIATAPPTVEEQQEAQADDWDLDITIVEGGPAADQLIRMTDDGCNSTCATACTSCP